MQVTLDMLIWATTLESLFNSSSLRLGCFPANKYMCVFLIQANAKQTDFVFWPLHALARLGDDCSLSCPMSWWHWDAEPWSLISRVASSAPALYSRHLPKIAYIKFISQTDL